MNNAQQKAIKDFQIEVRSDPILLKSIRALVRSYFSRFGLPEDRADELVLAVDEACTNSIRHSYENRNDETLLLSFSTYDEWLEIVLQDTGMPANPNKVKQRAAASPNAKTVQPGGLGVQLIYTAFDDVSFEPGSISGNRLVMRVRRSAITR